MKTETKLIIESILVLLLITLGFNFAVVSFSIPFKIIFGIGYLIGCYSLGNVYGYKIAYYERMEKEKNGGKNGFI